MGTIEEIISAIDKELIETEKDYLTLGQANKLLVDEGIMSIPERTDQAFKKLLEEDKIFHAFQTKGSPKQWRIPYSEGKNKWKAIKREKRELITENEFSQNINPKINDQITCPKCGIQMYFPNYLKKESYLQCLTCGESFQNPLKPSNNISKNQRNWIIGITVFLLLVIYWKSPNSNNQQNYSPTLFYINKESYVATSKTAFDQMFRYAADGDNEAFSSLFQTGEVITLNAGTEVFIVSTHFSYHVVRLRGSSQNLYVVMENITQK